MFVQKCRSATSVSIGVWPSQPRQPVVPHNVGAVHRCDNERVNLFASTAQSSSVMDALTASPAIEPAGAERRRRSTATRHRTTRPDRRALGSFHAAVVFVRAAVGRPPAHGRGDVRGTGIDPNVIAGSGDRTAHASTIASEAGRPGSPLHISNIATVRVRLSAPELDGRPF